MSEVQVTPPEGPPLIPPGRIPQRDRGGGRKTLTVLAAAFMVLVVLAAVVVWVLPDVTSGPDIGSGAEQADKIDSAGLEATAANAVEEAPEADNLMRQQALDAQQKWFQQKAGAELHNMALWGGEEFSAAVDLAGMAGEEFGKGDFTSAARGYNAALRRLKNIDASRAEILEDALQAGEDALDSGLGEEAAEKFKLVLAVDPADPGGMAGLKRAATIRRVHILLKESKKYRAAGEFEKARRILAEILQIDPLCGSAADLLKDTEYRIRRRDFDASMGRALSALAADDLNTAGNELNTASALFPEDPAVRLLSERLHVARKSAALNVLLRRASDAANREDWQEAIAFYRKALNVESTSVAAGEGLARVEKRLALVNALERIIAAPERLRDRGPLDDAGNTIRISRTVTDAGPKLRALIAQADAVVKHADMPVKVRFVSDGETDVIIFHVGRLGKFRERVVKLKPGRYTVAGMRKGYRDVRSEIRVKFNADRMHFVIKCDEKI